MIANIDVLKGILQNKDVYSLSQFLDFGENFVRAIEYRDGRAYKMSATIISLSDNRYCFFQYGSDYGYVVTRPINRELFLDIDSFNDARKVFLETLSSPRAYSSDDFRLKNINKIVYTCQQAIGCVLDSFYNSNKARKQNGELFELFIRNIVSECGVTVTNTDKTICINGSQDARFKFERDIVLLKDGTEKSIGQIKTSTKDRLDKAFVDKLMYSKHVDSIPYFVIILNDVQRKSNSNTNGKYATNFTFLPGHFKAYTIALNPLDGVYYIDILDKMRSDPDLNSKIFTFDRFITNDMWEFMA